jgi:hypothetical protein
VICINKQDFPTIEETYQGCGRVNKVRITHIVLFVAQMFLSYMVCLIFLEFWFSLPKLYFLSLQEQSVVNFAHPTDGGIHLI